MSVDGSHVSVRNRDGGRPAGTFRQEPVTAAGVPALDVACDDSTATVILGKGGGTLLDLWNTSSVSRFKVDNNGNVTTATGTAPSAPSAGVSTYSGAGGNVTTAGNGMLATVNKQGLTLLNSGTVPGSVLVAAGTAVASTASETELAAASIPAGDVTAGSTWLLKAGGVYSDTGTPTLAWGLRYGGAAGTSIATIAATTLGSGVSNLSWAAELTLVFYDTTHAVGQMLVDLGTSNSTNATTRLSSTSGAASVSVVTSSAKNLSLTVTWGTSSSSNTITPMWVYGMRLA